MIVGNEILDLLKAESTVSAKSSEALNFARVRPTLHRGSVYAQQPGDMCRAVESRMSWFPISHIRTTPERCERIARFSNRVSVHVACQGERDPMAQKSLNSCLDEEVMQVAEQVGGVFCSAG